MWNIYALIFPIFTDKLSSVFEQQTTGIVFWQHVNSDAGYYWNH